MEKLELLGHQMGLLLKRQWVTEENNTAFVSPFVSATSLYVSSDSQHSGPCFIVGEIGVRIRTPCAIGREHI